MADQEMIREEDDTEPNAATSMRQLHRHIAQREASRLARPEKRKIGKIEHASKKRSAVTSTPSGYRAKAGVDHDKNRQEEWCGPFSVARQMIAKREEARQKREAEQNEKQAENHPLDELIGQIEEGKKRKAHPSLQWKSNLKPEDSRTSPPSYYAKRQKRFLSQVETIPSLFKICVNFLVANFDQVEALGDVDSTIRRSICEELVAKKKLNSDAFQAIAEPGIEALELIDCAEVTQDQLSDSLSVLIPSGLRFLVLQHAGRCFGPKAVKSIKNYAHESKLFAISIGGAYLLKDEDAGVMLRAVAASLGSVEFKACPLLGKCFCSAVQESFSPSGSGTLLELSIEDLSLEKSDLLSLGSNCLGSLKNLSLRQTECVDDEVAIRLLDHVGEDFESIDLSFNHKITDDTLSAIRSCNKTGNLRSVQLCGLKNLTEVGLETLFTSNIPGLPSPPKLRKLNLSGCAFDAVTDNIVSLVSKASSMKREDGSISSNLSLSGGLVHVGIKGSSCTDDSMECLATTSANSLVELDMSFSPKITDKGIGYLVEKASHQFRKVKIWGCAQITDDFLDGHSRRDDSKFEVIGAWMKKF